MRTMNKFFLIGLGVLTLAGCASNEESIDVEKPDQSIPGHIDFTNGGGYDDFNDINSAMDTAQSLASHGVEIYSLDGAVANPKAGESAYAGRPKGQAIGSPDVEIFDMGQPDISLSRH